MSDAQNAAIKAEIRLAAMEYLLSHAFVSLYQLTNLPTVAVKQLHSDSLERLSKQTFRGLPPVLSDHTASEFRDAVARLQSSQLAMLAELRGEKP